MGILIGLIGLYYSRQASKKLKSSAISATRRMLNTQVTMNQLLNVMNCQKEQIKNPKINNEVITVTLNTLQEITLCAQRNIIDSIEDWKDILGKDYDNFVNYRKAATNAILETELSPKYIELQNKIEDLLKQGNEKSNELNILRAEIGNMKKDMLNKIENIKEKYNSPLVVGESSGLPLTSVPLGNSIVSSFGPLTTIGFQSGRRRVYCPCCDKDLTLELEATQPGITNPYSVSSAVSAIGSVSDSESLITCQYCNKKFNLKNAKFTIGKIVWGTQ
ncbi:MAG: hypothetical protein QME51_07560 [Planctomycetota bacterium]|nr:hypothetical protein [Planctomycetota bacterium]